MEALFEDDTIDLFDALEQGLLKEYPTDLLSAAPQNGKFKTCVFSVNEKFDACSLTDQTTGKFLIRAYLDSKAKRWNYCQYNNYDESEIGEEITPFAYLQQNKNDDFVLWNRDCHNCDTNFNYKCSSYDSGYREQLMYIHSCLIEWDDEEPVNTLQLVIPTLDKNKTRWSWCSRNYPDTLNFNSDYFSFKYVNNRMIEAEEFFKDKEAIYMESRALDWDEEDDDEDSKSMNDGDDVDAAARKREFELLRLGDEEEDVLASFMMKTKDTYILEYKYPFSAVQAFSLGIAAMYWK